MWLSSVLIIYFAFGVPFGLLTAYLSSPRLDPADILRVLYNLIFWPAMAFTRALTAVIRSVQKKDSSPSPAVFIKYDRDSFQGIDRALRRRIDSQRTILAGLEDAYRTAVNASELSLPFRETIQHPDPGLAAKCFHRRNIARLELHISKARTELSKSLGELHSENHADPQAVNLHQLEDMARDLC